MDWLRFIYTSLSEACALIVHLDPYLFSVISVSLRVSLTALAVSALISAGFASLISWGKFPGRGLLRLLVHTGMGLPAVIVGLFVLVLLTRDGPFGALGLIWTPTAMVISQSALITPLMTGVMLSALESVDGLIADAATALGASRWGRAWAVIREARLGFITAIIAGFGRAISEVGSVMLVGGNIAWSDGLSYTRTLTTAIVVETRKGNFETALALGLILLVIVLGINLIASSLQRRRGWQS
ncbi:MAG: ABC transporter permease [Candidatus Bipolaricaulia bacterium]